jgi:G patch domain-containing protein 1
VKHFDFFIDTSLRIINFCAVIVSLLTRFHPPTIPSNFRPIHKFAVPLDQTLKDYNNVPPPDALPPENANLRLLIEGSAAMVARCGKSIEDVYMEKSKTNSLFSFLRSGAEGHDYYIRKLWENKQKFVDKSKQAEKLTAERRGRILGERPLASTTFGGNDVKVKAREVINSESSLGDSLTKSLSLVSSLSNIGVSGYVVIMANWPHSREKKFVLDQSSPQTV